MKKTILILLILSMSIIACGDVTETTDPGTDFTVSEVELTNGKVVIRENPNLSIHSYVSSDMTNMVACHVLETENQLILIDAQMLLPMAGELKEYIEGLSKPVERIIITHSHPDHWFGLEALEELGPIYALEETIGEMNAMGAFFLGGVQAGYGELAPTKIVIPENTLSGDSLEIDGLKLGLETFSDTESVLQLLVTLPDYKTIVAQDLIFNKVHLFLGQNTFDGWISVLEELKGRGNIDLILSGHGVPAGPELFDSNIEYLQAAKTALAEVTTFEEFKTRLVEAYPDYNGVGLFGLVADMLFPPTGFEVSETELTNGKVVIRGSANLSIHSYVSSDMTNMVASHVLETENQLILIDAQMLLPTAGELKEYIGNLDKPVERIIITHSHPDHWFGLEALEELGPIYALEETIGEMNAMGEIFLEGVQAGYGELAPTRIVIPENTLSGDSLEIDGLQIGLETFSDAEAGLQLMVTLPDYKAIVAQDLVFNQVHLFLGQNAFDDWSSILEDLKGRGNIELILAGHGVPGGPELFDSNIEYLQAAKAALDEATTFEEFKTRLVEAYPDYNGVGLLDMMASMLFGE